MNKQGLEQSIADTKEILESLNGDLKITNDAIQHYINKLVSLKNELYRLESE